MYVFHTVYPHLIPHYYAHHNIPHHIPHNNARLIHIRCTTCSHAHSLHSSHLDLQATSSEAGRPPAPMVSYPQPTLKPKGEGPAPFPPEPPVGLLVVLGSPIDPGPNVSSDALVVSTAKPYPAIPVLESVYASVPPPAPPPGSAAGSAPGPAPGPMGRPGAPRPNFASQLASPVAPPATTFLVTVPAGVGPGEQLRVSVPGGGEMTLVVPPGVGPGMQLQLQAPGPSAPPLQAAPLIKASLQPYR